jgi:hypothetical protein
MAKVHVTCGVDGCDASWDVNAAAMKKTLADHRRVAHPGWTPPEKKPGEAYRLDYSQRGRQL